MKMGRDPAPPIATVGPILPENLCLVVDRALAFDRDRRYPDAGSMLEDVRAVLRGEAPPVALRLLATSLPHTPIPAADLVTTLATSSSEVPIYLSGFSSLEASTELSEGVSTDPEPSPDVKRISTPDIVIEGALETTLPSPVDDEGLVDPHPPGSRPPRR
jgi:hypothetical protein